MTDEKRMSCAGSTEGSGVNINTFKTPVSLDHPLPGESKGFLPSTSVSAKEHVPAGRLASQDTTFLTKATRQKSL